MPHIRTHLVAWASLGLVACKSSPPKPPQPSEHALAGLAAQHVAVLPSYAVKLMPGLGALEAKPVEFERNLDTAIPAAFEDRGIKKAWLFPPELRASYRRNSSYAAIRTISPKNRFARRCSPSTSDSPSRSRRR